MRKTLACFLAATTLLAAASATACPIDVSGTVLDHRQNPAPGFHPAIVTLLNSNYGFISSVSCTTNANGKFSACLWAIPGFTGYVTVEVDHWNSMQAVETYGGPYNFGSFVLPAPCRPCDNEFTPGAHAVPVSGVLDETPSGPGPGGGPEVTDPGDDDAPNGAFSGRSHLELVSPNPIVDGTTIRYTAAANGGSVRISVHDVTGRLVRELVQEAQAPGSHSTRWDARDASGSRVPAGVYFVSLRTSKSRETVKITVLK
ncbi:MAG TPA: FlgD immunoglobulin-like domain containing protein [bacterium]|nr:FlgD immunoglobulin-like domain containing protein [bacterium]